MAGLKQAAEVVADSFGKSSDHGNAGFERMYAELLIMLGDEAYTQALGSRFDVAEAAMSHEAATRLLSTLESLLATQPERDLGGDDIDFNALEANRSNLCRVNWKKDGF